MLKINELRTTEETQQSELSHRKALLAALAPDPAAWEYRGEMIDSGPASRAHCACGHPIRYVFPVYRGGEVRPIGSTCITHYATVSAEQAARMQARLDATQAAIREAAKQARQAAADRKAEQAAAAYREAYDRIKAIYRSFADRGRHAPREIWALAQSYRYALPSPDRPPEYQRASDLTRWFAKHTDTANCAIQRFNAESMH